jgi:gluconate 2-dehydrogenase gamma chain
MARRWSRRQVLKDAAAAGAAGALARGALAQRRAAAPVAFENLSAAEGRTLEAVVARLIPSDENGPGAAEAGAARYIDRALGDALAGSRDAYAAGLAALDASAQRSRGRPFADLESGEQDALLGDMEDTAFFGLVREHTIQGTFCDPYYGGNEDFVGWELIGYPGIRLAVGPDAQRMDAKLTMNRVSAYDLPMFEAAAPPGGDDDR